MKISLGIFFLVCLLSCNTENKSYMKADKILTDFSEFEIVNYPDGKLHYLVDSVNGKEFGNLFEFYRNGYLTSYSFMIDSIRATYDETFDSTSHKIIRIEGNPIVYKTIDADTYKDSLAIQYLISNFSYSDIEFSISDSLQAYKSISLRNNLRGYGKLPYLYSALFIKNTKHTNRVFIVAKFIGVLKNSNVVKTYTDTIDISKSKANQKRQLY
jgi:hypothetical protein